ncbi:hypothetical protein NST69_17890 [Paenibacillus sp. FSL P2-0089]|uniref:hypothetical protein n=1 Tax=Paenibacillus sp. FSL P2-0089 TaxID=2954526 RepID=UPI00315B13F2
MFENSMKTKQEIFNVYRKNKDIGTLEGIKYNELSTGRSYIVCNTNSDIQPGDILVSQFTKEEICVEDIQSEGLHKGAIFQKKAYYTNKYDNERLQNKVQHNVTSFNIGSAQNSVIGNQSNASLVNIFNVVELEREIEQKGDEDKEELRSMINEIKEMFEDSEKVKKGSLSRFSGIMQKHSWITGSVAKLGLDFLLGPIIK